MAEKQKIVVENAFSGVYFMAFVGAAIYYIQQATGFLEGVIGFIKAIFWPAMLVYRAFELMGM